MPCSFLLPFRHASPLSPDAFTLPLFFAFFILRHADGCYFAADFAFAAFFFIFRRYFRYYDTMMLR